MRRCARVLVAVTSLLTALFVAFAASPAPVVAVGSAASDSAFVDQMLFHTSLSAFVADAKSHLGPDGRVGDAWFDWSTDFCSAPLVGNTGRSFNFTDPCRRHDFGYRNSKLLDQRYGAGRYWNGDARKRIDQQFLADMKATCRGRFFLNIPPCMSWAYTFYSVVRAAGGP
jgi:hypothetical protein